MSKYEDDAMELIETVAENSHHNAAKPFGRGAMSKGQMIDVKSAETGMLLERIKKMAEVYIYYLTHSISATVLKDSPPSHFKRHRRVPIARDSITSY